MSDTDKTRPAWVQMFDPHNRGWLEEHHHHDRGAYRRPLDDCDIADAHPRDGWRRCRCCYWPSVRAHYEGVYARPSKRVEYFTFKTKRRERSRWRQVRSRLLGGDLDAAEVVPRRYTARHEGLWEAW